MMLTRRQFLGVTLGTTLALPLRGQGMPGLLLDVMRPANLASPLLQDCQLWLVYLPGLQANMGLWRNLMGGNDGTPTNFAAATTSTRGLSPATTRRGGFGEMRLNGTTTQGGVLHPVDALRFVGTVSLLFWVYFTTTPTGGERRLVASAEADGTPDHAYAVHTINDVTTIKMRWNGVDRLTSSGSLGTGTWRHVAAVRSGTTGSWVARIYIDGKLDATSGTVTQNAPLTAGDLTSWGCNPAGGFVLNGMMDDMMIYDRDLTAMEIQAIYQDGLFFHPQMLNWVDLAALRAQTSAQRKRMYVY